MRVKKKLYLRVKKNIKRYIREDIRNIGIIREYGQSDEWKMKAIFSFGDLIGHKRALAKNEEFYKNQIKKVCKNYERN